MVDMPRLRSTAELLRWAAGTWLLWRVPTMCSPVPCSPVPIGLMPVGLPARSVSVIVPARDESATLPVLLATLAAQTRPPDEVIVVDDGSTDATAALAASLGATVLTAGALPPGWSGKAWACAAGAQAASGDILVFLDADTWLQPDGLDRLVTEHAWLGGTGLVSAAPFHRISRPYEALSAMCNLVSMIGTGAFTPLGGWARSVGSFGPCAVVARSEYHVRGGHGALEGAMVDDLSARFREAGAPVRLVGGRGAIDYRMYPGGLDQLVEGWSKNLASGAGITRPVVLGLVVAWVSGLIVAGWRVALPGRTWRRIGTYVAYGLQVEWMLGRIGSFGLGVGLAYPVPLGAFLGCFANSVRLTVGRGEVRWKGRTVAVGRRRPRWR